MQLRSTDHCLEGPSTQFSELPAQTYMSALCTKQVSNDLFPDLQPLRELQAYRVVVRKVWCVVKCVIENDYLHEISSHLSTCSRRGPIL